MISVDHVRRFAAYNAWMNGKVYSAAAGLSDEARRTDRGAFFGSIHGTLNHLLWGDQMWMSRFAGTPKPAATIRESRNLIGDFGELRAGRERFDAVIVDWAARLDPDWLVGDLTWFSGAAGREVTKPKWLLVTHMFNHQTHHRGQVHCLLTQCGVDPGDTDLPFMPG
jgi:uncharacterized damage-inducible protein DinB